jgi:hypothetical protein
VENWVGAGNDGFVVTWYDQEESADMTQSTAANQPRIVNAGTLETKGGKTAVYFDGSNDYVSRTSFTSLYTYPFTIMGVSSNDASAAQGVVFSQRLSAGDQSGVSLFCDRRTNKTGFLLDEGSTNHQFNYTAQDNTANQRLQTFIIDSSGNGELWKDGTSQESIAGIGAFSTNPSTVADIGRQQAGPLYIQGFVQELIVWGSTDQTSNRTAIENNINENYDLYWNGQNTSLLDDYGSAAAAYSLRNLDSSYTGALVRIRRSSDSAERDFYGTWNGEFPTTAVQDWVGANDGFVVTWYDQSGNSNDVTQATAANQPKLVNVGSVYTLNGKPTLSFDATNDVLSRAAITALNTEPVSYFTVYQSFTADTNSRALFNTGSGATDNSRIMGYDGSHTTVPALSLVRNTSSTNYYTSASPSLSVSTPYLQTGVYDSGKGIESWIDGSSQGTTTFTGTYVNDTFELGAMTNISIYKDGSISEFIIYASDQTSNRTDIETNINDHYSIY